MNISKIASTALLALCVVALPHPSRGQTFLECMQIENRKERDRCLDKPEHQDELKGGDACALLVAYAMAPALPNYVDAKDLAEQIRLCSLSRDCRDTADFAANQKNRHGIKPVCRN
jgi:hypothetical protein